MSPNWTSPHFFPRITMSVAASNLISLLRLLSNDLPADAAIRVRQQLADDAHFANQYRQLTQVAQSNATPGELLGHVAGTDPVDVARFLDGSLADEELAAFERRCWESTSLLREVVSAWNAIQNTELLEPAADSQERARAIVARLLSPLPAAEAVHNEERPAQIEAIDVPSTVSGSPSPVSAPVDALPAESEAGSFPQLRVESEPAVLKRPRRDSGLVIVAATVVLAVLFAAFRYWLPDTQQIAQPEESLPHGESLQNERHRSRIANIAQDDSDSSPARPEADPQSPRNAVPLNSPDTRIVQEERLQMRPKPQRPQPTVPQGPASLGPEGPTVVIAKWSQIDGIAAARATQSEVWSGIQSRSASGLWLSSQASQLLTLSYSRVAGELSGGTTVIADADSLIEISAQSAVSGKDAGNGESELTPLLTVHRGRLAIEGLTAGQRLLVQVASRLVDIEATQNNTTVAVERKTSETVLAAYRGEVKADERRFTRRTWGRFDSAGEIAAFRPPRPTDWYRPARTSVVPDPDICQAFNTAADIVQVAARYEADPDVITGTIASQTVLHCSIEATQSISAAVAGKLAGSSNGAHRVSLIQWLISRFRDNRVVGESDLRLICRTQQTDQATTAAMLGWFHSAADGLSPTTTQLSELISGLRDTSPLFTRQCALTFLQQILGDPLPEYSVSTPNSRAVMSSIAAKARVWQQSQR